MRSLSLGLLSLTLAGCGAPSLSNPSIDESAAAISLASIPVQWRGTWDRFDNGKVGAKYAVATNGTKWDLVWIGDNSHLYDRTGDGVHWNAPQDLGSGFVGDCAAVYTRSGLVIAAVNGRDSSVSTINRGLNDSWFDWTNIGGTVRNGVALAATGYYAHVFGIGTDGALWEKSGIGTLWDANWVSRGGILAWQPPAAVSWGGDRIDVVATDASGNVWHYYQDNESTPRGWGPLPGVQLAGAPAISSWGPNHLDFFGIDKNNAVYQLTWDNAFTTWTKILDCAWGSQLAAVSPPSAADLSNAQVDLYVTGMDHWALWHDRAIRGADTTNGPKPFCCGLKGRSCCSADDQPAACFGQALGDVACDASTNSCQQCGSAPGQACCTHTDAAGSYPACGYDGSRTTCNVYNDRCVDSASPGGGAYQVCRTNGVCDSGYTCTGRTATVAGYCKPSAPACTTVGGSCSASSGCCSGLACLAGKCAATSGVTTCGGNPVGANTAPYVVGVRAPTTLCAVTEWGGYANSQAEATSCAQSLFPGYSLLPGQTYSQYSYAQYSPFSTCTTISVSAFSQSDANSCAVAQCVNCSTVPNGQCP